MLRMQSETARPTVIEPRPPAPPMQPPDMSKPSSARVGPLTISMGNTLEVVVLTPNRLNSGSAMASKAATTKGKASG